MGKSSLAVIKEEGNVAYLWRKLSEAQEAIKEQIKKLTLLAKRDDYNLFLHFNSEIYSQVGLYNWDVIEVILPEYANDRWAKGNEILIRNAIVKLQIQVKGLAVKKKDYFQEQDDVYLWVTVILYTPKDYIWTRLDAFSWDEEVAKVFKELDYYNWKDFIEGISVSYKIDRSFGNKVLDLKHKILQKLKQKGRK